MKNDTRPLMVTIRCLAYNQEKYIRQCLEGFVMQKTNFRFEAIIHDDASTDGTADIIREFEAKYPDIIKPIYETENQYSKHDGSIYRIMEEHTHGKYVAYCEGDDYWIDPLKLQKQFDILENDPTISLCHHDFKILANGELTERKNVIPVRQKLIDVARHNYAQTLTMFYRNPKEPLVPQEFSKGRNVYQFFYNVRLAEYGDIYYINEPMGVYRLQENSIYASKSWFVRYEMAMDNIDNMKEWFTNWHPNKEVISALNKRACNLSFWNFLSLLKRLELRNSFKVVRRFFNYL